MGLSGKTSHPAIAGHASRNTPMADRIVNMTPDHLLTRLHHQQQEQQEQHRHPAATNYGEESYGSFSMLPTPESETTTTTTTITAADKISPNTGTKHAASSASSSLISTSRHQQQRRRASSGSLPKPVFEASADFTMNSSISTSKASMARTSMMIQRRKHLAHQHHPHPWGPEAQGLQDVDTVAGDTATLTYLGMSHSTFESSRGSGSFFRTVSQRKFAMQQQHHQQLQHYQDEPHDTKSESGGSRLGVMLRLHQEQLEEDFHSANIRHGIEIARKNLHTMCHWKTPYDLDAPRAIMLGEQSSTDTSSSSNVDASVSVEQRIWTGIEALMADAFSDDGYGSSTVLEDVLPLPLVRAVSQRSLFSDYSKRISNSSEDSSKEEEQQEAGSSIDLQDIEMAQVALNSFMDMLLPPTDEEHYDSMPSLVSVRNSDEDSSGSFDRIALAEVALHNFLDVLLQDMEQDVQKQKSKVRLLDIFQWSLKVNVDAQEKIKFLEKERIRLEKEREKELLELQETERRIEEEREKRKQDEEIRRKRILELERHLAHEQRQQKGLLVPATSTPTKSPSAKFGGEAMSKQNVDAMWASIGGMPIVNISDDSSIDPSTLPPLASRRYQQQQHQQQKPVSPNNARFSSSSGELNTTNKSSGELTTKSMPTLGSVTFMSDMTIDPTTVPQLHPARKRLSRPFPNSGLEGLDLSMSSRSLKAPVEGMPTWAAIGGRPLVMSTSDGSQKSLDSPTSNLLPSSFHEGDAIRNLSDSGSSGVLPTRFGGVRKEGSSGSSPDEMPSLASISEGSVLVSSRDISPTISLQDLRMEQEEVPSRFLPAPKRRMPKYYRPSSSRRRLLSAAGDIYTDDLSEHSLNRFFTDMRKPVALNKPHTDVILVGSAGDIHRHHVVGVTVRYDDDGSVGSDPSLVSLDPELQRDEIRNGGGVHYVPEVNSSWQRKGRRRAIGSRIKKSLKVMRERGRCVTMNWCRDNYNSNYNSMERNRRKTFLASNSKRCLLYEEESPYDRTHVLEPLRVAIDEHGFPDQAQNRRRNNTQ